MGMKGTRDEWERNKEKIKDMGVGKKKRRKTKWKIGKEMGKKRKNGGKKKVSGGCRGNEREREWEEKEKINKYINKNK